MKKYKLIKDWYDVANDHVDRGLVVDGSPENRDYVGHQNGEVMLWPQAIVENTPEYFELVEVDQG